jgi:histidinol-phosphatase
MPSRELSAALEAARAAAEVIQASYRRNLAVTLKADCSPVTAADLEAERAIRAVLSAHFPDYGFYGEETGQHAMDAGNVWLVDPIDGTKSFVRDCPFFSTQIALRRAGRLVLGVSSAPVYGELAWAEEGGGAFLDGQPVRVSAVGSLSDAILSTGNLKTLAAAPAAWSRFGALVGQVSRLRGYGDFLEQPIQFRCHRNLAGQPAACLSRFPALPPAGARLARSRHRIRRQYPGHRGAERDRARGRRRIH